MKKIYRLILSLLVLTFSAGMLNAQDRVVNGKVTDGVDGTALPGVNILEKGTYNGSLTDMNGEFSIKVSENAILVFSFVGFNQQEIEVGNQSTINVVMTPDIHQLQEVVVIGYGQQKKEDLTGSVVAIGNKDFNKGVITSPQDLMIGKIAGVVVTPGSGAPGSAATIRVRGGSSLLANNNPLVVIDGFPVDDSDISGMSNPLATLNPNDIETFTILKDASATAIYGSRASNGVILITTKRGQKGKLTLSYNGQASVSSPMRTIDVFSADEYRAMVNELNEEGLSGLNDKAITRLGNADTDWQKEIYRNAISQDHNISLSGSTANVPFRISYGYTDQQGILKTTEMKRHTVDLNFTPTFLEDHLKVTANIKGMYGKHNFGEEDAVGAAIAYDPTQPVRNDNTRFGGYFTWVNTSDTLPNGAMNPNGYPNPIGVSNPVALLDQTDDRSNVYRTISNLQLDYKFHFLPELRVNVNAGIDYTKSDGINNSPVEAAFTYGGGIGRRIDYTGENYSKLLDIYFNYVKELGDHKVDLMAGYSWQHFYREGSNFDRNALEGEDRVIADSSIFKNENYLVSFFGRANYSFKSKYLLTATLRADGSSRFGKENRWGTFPALAFAWRLSEEVFLSDINVLSDLKLRLGYGITGQQDISDSYYPYMANYRRSFPTAQYNFGNRYYHTLRPDPYDANIKWEETTTYNIGLDFGFLDDKIYGSVDVYKRETKDLINSIPVAAGSNFSNFLTTNVGDLENKGVEVTINTRPVSNNNLNWTLGANLSYNENKITGLTKTNDPNYPGVDEGLIAGGVGNRIQIHQVGHPAFSFYMYQQVYDESGMPIEGLYIDRSGVGDNAQNKYYYNDPAPNFLAGVNSSVNYKQIDFSFSGRFSFNNYVYNNVMSERAVYQALYNQSGFFNNLPTGIRETEFVTPQYWSDHYVENASFFKMDFMSLGYNFEQLFSQKLKARLSFTVQNAFVITDYSGIDPEVFGGIDGNIYPRPRTFLLGLNLTY